MLPTQAFPESLQPISLWRAFEASLARNPQKIALIHSGGQLRYIDLHDLLKTPTDEWSLDKKSFAIVQLLQSLSLHSSRKEQHDENTPLIGVSPTLSERELMMYVLNIAVCHPILSCDTVSALPCYSLEDQYYMGSNDRMSLTNTSNLSKAFLTGWTHPSDISPMFAIAALTPLLLGGTLWMIQDGNLSSMTELIAQGLVNQVWLDDNSSEGLLDLQLTTPAQSFRGLICLGLPRPNVVQTLSNWVGPERLHALALNKHSKPWARYLMMSETLEPYPGLDLEHG